MKQTTFKAAKSFWAWFISYPTMRCAALVAIHGATLANGWYPNWITVEVCGYTFMAVAALMVVLRAFTTGPVALFERRTADRKACGLLTAAGTWKAFK